MNLSSDELEQYVKDLALDEARWRSLVRHHPNERVYIELDWTEDFNSWLICWMENHETGFHDHDGSAVAVKVVSGFVVEERLRLVSQGCIKPHATPYGPGDIIRLGPNDIHNVKHTGTLPTVSIHAYSPPLVRMGSYGFGADDELRRLPMFSSEKLRPLEAAALASIAEESEVDNSFTSWDNYPYGEQPIST